MKKPLSLFLVGILFLCASGVASAESVDFKILNDVALVDLLYQVQQEIADRRIEKSATLLAGKYIAGKDIPVGSYKIYCKYDGSWWASISVKDKNGEEKFSGTVFSQENPTDSSKGEKSWLVNLSEGDVLECNEEVTLTIFAGVMFQ